MFPSAFAVVVAAAQASALARARAVAAKAPPEVTNGSRVGGEHEAAAWWEEHDALFGAARAEWGPKHFELYDFDTHEDDFIDPGLRAAVRAAESAAAAGLHVDEEILRAHLHPTNVPGVYRLRLFTPRFCRLLLEELRHVAESGVPIRRPNGMNRFGAILEAVPGGLHMERLAARIARRYARPLAQMAFPHLVGAGDASEHFGFVVDYRQGGDESLALHADASVATLNVRLGNQPFEGGQLCFRGLRMVDDQPRDVAATCLSWDSFEAGEAILHLGGLYHAAERITAGERSNLVQWLFGRHGTVRVAPYAEGEEGRTVAEGRWGAAATERAVDAWERDLLRRRECS